MVRSSITLRAHMFLAVLILLGALGIFAASRPTYASQQQSLASGGALTELKGIQEGQTADGKLSIEAIVNGPVQRVTFQLDGPKPATHVEMQAPYFFLGDQNGTPTGWDTARWPDGSYMLTATSIDASGKRSSMMIHFLVQNTAARKRTPVPTAQPTSAATAQPTGAPTTIPTAQPTSAPTTPPAPVTCYPLALPLGALSPAKPIWCSTLTNGPTTFTQAGNSWVDSFDHGLMNAELGAGYRAYDSGGELILKAQNFRHNNHWMVDVAGHDGDGGPPWNLGGALMRPDRSFRFENGKLIVEADVAAGIEPYGTNAWPEIVISNAPAPTGKTADPLYAYGVFGGAWSIGCRLQSTRIPVCAMYDPTDIRTFELSFWQLEGAQVFGGGPFSPELDAAWRVCRDTDPDLNCRDRFRWELTRDTLTLYVNGVKYMEHKGLPAGKQLPDELVNGDVYVYFASWTYKAEADTIRYHWDRLAVNPATPPGPAALSGMGTVAEPGQ